MTTLISETIKKELQLVQAVPVCNLSDDQFLSGIIAEPQSLSILISAKDEFYNAKLLKAIACEFDSYLILPNDVSRTANSKHVLDLIQLRKALNVRLNKINKRYIPTSVEGIVWDATVRYVDNFAIVKTDITRQGSLFHEYFIGAYCLNPLRALIPNFAYVYGYFRCGMPVRLPDRNTAESFCSKMSESGYMLQEKIESESLEKLLFTKQLDDFDLLSTICQVVLALRTAYMLTDFTHYDLHTGNIMLRKLDSPATVRYCFNPMTPSGVVGSNQMPAGGQIPVGNQTSLEKGSIDCQPVYIVCRYVATIIDFGRSHATFQGQHYYFKTAEKWADVYRGTSHPAQDLYKFISYIVFVILKSGDLERANRFGNLLTWFPHVNEEVDRIRLINESRARRGEALINEYSSFMERDKKVNNFEIKDRFPQADGDETLHQKFFEFLVGQFDLLKNVVVNKPVFETLDCEGYECSTVDELELFVMEDFMNDLDDQIEQADENIDDLDNELEKTLILDD